MDTYKIDLRGERDFGEIFNASLSFLRQEINALGKAILVFVLPTAILLSLFSTYVSASVVMYNAFWKSILNAFAALIAQTIIYVTVYSYLNLYFQKLKNITNKELFREMRSNFFKVFWAILAIVIIVVIAIAICYGLFANTAPSVGGVLAIITAVYLLVSLSILVAITVFERNGFFNAFSRSFKLTHMKWWNTFLIIMVGGIIVFVILMILQSPIIVFSFVMRMHGSYESFTEYFTILTIYSSLSSAVAHIFYTIPAFLAAFQYLNLVEAREKPSLRSRINEIGENE